MIRQSGTTTLKGIADALNDQSITTARGGQWPLVQMQRVEARAA